LDLSYNADPSLPTRDADFLALDDALANLPNLKALNLAFNQLGATSSASLDQLMGSIGNLKSLLLLNISHNALGDNGASSATQALGEALQNLQHLQFLDLSYNQLGAPSVENLSYPGTTAVLQGISKLGRLEYISLQGNSLGSAGSADLARTLGDMLRRLPSVLHLDISDNGLGKGSLEEETAIVDGLVYGKPNLCSLRIQGNRFGSHSPLAPRKIIDFLTRVTEFQIGDMPVSWSSSVTQMNAIIAKSLRERCENTMCYGKHFKGFVKRRCVVHSPVTPGAVISLESTQAEQTVEIYPTFFSQPTTPAWNLDGEDKL